MSRIILLIFLVINSGILGGCSLIAPFKPVSSCSDVVNGGATCASVESNLEYSLGKDDGTVIETPVTEDNKKKKKEQDNLTEESLIMPLHSDLTVEKDELVRLMNELNIDSTMTKRPILIPATSYRVMILPYSDGTKFYSGRYIYITAGKPKWVADNYVISGDKYKIDVPTPKKVASPNTSYNPLISEAPKKNNAVVDISSVSKVKPVKHRVSAYLLNCRDLPGLEGTSVAVFEQDRVLNIIDKSQEWWKVTFYEMECYVNPKYLYSESEQ